MADNTCIACGREKERAYLWFCDGCTLVKEQSYQDSSDKGENDFADVVIARDLALSKRREELERNG